MRENESKTVLRGKSAVEKSDPQIMLRGEIDGLLARAVMTCAYAKHVGYTEIVSGTEDIVRVIRELMRCEALGETPCVTEILGMSLDELRTASQKPKSELGLEHYIPDAETDLMTAHLNLLRTDIRRTERAACAAEKGNPADAGIQMVLNRLSSAAYILMLENRANRI